MWVCAPSPLLYFMIVHHDLSWNIGYFLVKLFRQCLVGNGHACRELMVNRSAAPPVKHLSTLRGHLRYLRYPVVPDNMSRRPGNSTVCYFTIINLLILNMGYFLVKLFRQCLVANGHACWELTVNRSAAPLVQKRCRTHSPLLKFHVGQISWHLKRGQSLKNNLQLHAQGTI